MADPGATGSDSRGGPADHRIDVLTISSWYPSADNIAYGRFVLDQVTALAATGNVRPRIVSFELIPLLGPPGLRRLQLASIESTSAAAIRDGELDPFAPTALFGPRSIPIARLPIASGRAPGRGPDHGTVARSVALEALGDRLLRQGRLPDLIHAHTGYPDGAAAAVLAARIDRPLIITEHATFLQKILARPETRSQYEAGVGRADRVIAVSESLAAELRRSIPSLATDRADRLVVIANAVAVEDFSAGTEAERHVDELVFVGYRIPTKGIASLLRAFALVRDRRPAASLTLIGGAPTTDLEDGWIALARELGITDAVRFEGPADRAGVARAFRRASVFVHASPWETFGVVAVEALAAGLPVVSVDSGGVTEILGQRPEALGAIVPPDDPAALAAAIVGVLERRATFDPVAVRASVARFAAPLVAGRIVELYRTVLATSGRPPTDRTAPGVPTAGAEGDPPDHRPVVVAGFGPGTSERIAASLPTSVRATIRIAGVPVPGSARADAGSGSSIAGRVSRELDRADSLGAAARGSRPRRVLSMARHPRRTWQRVRHQRHLDALIWGEAQRAVDAAVASAGGRPGAAVRLIVLDGVGQLAADGAIGSGSARATPGGLRHLADLARPLDAGAAVNDA